jgi:hypothetical protein
MLLILLTVFCVLLATHTKLKASSEPQPHGLISPRSAVLPTSSLSPPLESLPVSAPLLVPLLVPLAVAPLVVGGLALALALLSVGVVPGAPVEDVADPEDWPSLVATSSPQAGVQSRASVSADDGDFIITACDRSRGGVKRLGFAVAGECAAGGGALGREEGARIGQGRRRSGQLVPRQPDRRITEDPVMAAA